MRLSSQELVEKDRNAAIHDLFARAYLNIDIAFLTEEPLLEAYVWQLPGLVVTTGTLSESCVSSHDPASEGDTLIFGGGFGGKAILRCRDQEMLCPGRGESVLFRGSDRIWSQNQPGWAPRTVRIDAPLVEGLLPDLDGRMMQTVTEQNQALQLLDQYLPLVCTPAVMSSPNLAQAASQHIVDLVLLAIGGAGDVAHHARARGHAAARSAEVRNWVTRRACDPGLSLDQVARAHRVSPRTIQEVFHREETSFSEFVLALRLRQANRHLADSTHDGHSISTIAFSVGFSDLSYFNRRFRRRFGKTPSDVRARARALCPELNRPAP